MAAMKVQEDIHFGWFIPTGGDTTAYGVPSATIKPSLEMFVRVAQTAESAGFEYALVPVQTACYEAWISCAMIAAQTSTLKLLIAARPGYVQPATMAKMISTFDQLSGGRVCINLIAGPGGAEEAAEGLHYEHDSRYAIMDETVTIMKRLWTEAGPVNHRGRFFQLEDGRIRPKPLQQPHPPFYLGGVSAAAIEVCGKHADVYLTWLDTPERVAREFAQAKEAAARHGRADDLRLGVRAQILVREREEDARRDAEALTARAPKHLKNAIRGMWEQSEANTRMKELAASADLWIGPHLWAGVTAVRPGAGVLIVGTPDQVAGTLRTYVELGASEFCLSGYPHDEEAERFGRWVMPQFKGLAATPQR
ncbi:MAG: LLM class flavin-dependent oxidoreductase [Dehalococcoidia bacterium]